MLPTKRTAFALFSVIATF